MGGVQDCAERWGEDGGASRTPLICWLSSGLDGATVVGALAELWLDVCYAPMYGRWPEMAFVSGKFLQ